MAKAYRYDRTGPSLQYFSNQYDAHEEVPDGVPPTQHPLVRDLFPVRRLDALDFAPGVPDIRGFCVNTPNGDSLGAVEGFLADAENGSIPYAYVLTEGNRHVVVPTSQLLILPSSNIVTLEGGRSALDGAPEAQYDISDADRADRYWMDYRRRNAA